MISSQTELTTYAREFAHRIRSKRTIVSALGLTAAVTVGMLPQTGESQHLAKDPVTTQYVEHDGTVHRIDQLSPDTCPAYPLLAEENKLHNQIIISKKSDTYYSDVPSTKESVEQTIDLLSEATSPDQITAALDEYTSTIYGFETKMTSSDPKSYKLAQFKDGAFEFTNYLSLFNPELIKRAGIKSLNLLEPLEGVPYAYYSHKIEELGIRVTLLSNPNIFIHEALGHGMHRTSCEGNNSTDRPMEDIRRSSLFIPDKYAYATDYAKTGGLAEDYADSLSAYATGQIDSTILRDGNHPLTQKVILNLSRAEELVPGSAEDIIGIREELIRMEQNQYVMP